MTRRVLAPRPEIKLTSSALQDRFLTTGPPGKSHPPYSLLWICDQANFGWSGKLWVNHSVPNTVCWLQNPSHLHCEILLCLLKTFSDFISLHPHEIGMKFLAALGIWKGKIKITWLNKKWTLFYAKTQRLFLHSHDAVSLRGLLSVFIHFYLLISGSVFMGFIYFIGPTK